MRETLIQVRINHELHNHPSERPEGFPVTFTGWDGREWVETLPVAEHPISWVMLILQAPGVLRGRELKEFAPGLLMGKSDDQRVERLLARSGVKSVAWVTPGIQAELFQRWLAKIGYSYAVACLGLPAVKDSPLVRVILEDTGQHSHWVGGLNHLGYNGPQSFLLDPAEPEVFRVKLVVVDDQHGKPYWAVYIRLLPFLLGPSYLVVVREKCSDRFPLPEYSLKYEGI